ncbi:MAG: hypothetical protein WC314_05825 [Vulcanimicrobiota bacterium]
MNNPDLVNPETPRNVLDSLTRSPWGPAKSCSDESNPAAPVNNDDPALTVYRELFGSGYPDRNRVGSLCALRLGGNRKG